VEFAETFDSAPQSYTENFSSEAHASEGQLITPIALQMAIFITE
jgi:hypothetical protein